MEITELLSRLRDSIAEAFDESIEIARDIEGGHPTAPPAITAAGYAVSFTADGGINAGYYEVSPEEAREIVRAYSVRFGL